MKTFLLKVFFFFIQATFSQNLSTLGNDQKEITRLKSEISLTKIDSIKCVKYLRLSAFYFKNNDINNYKSNLNLGKKYASKSSFLKSYSKYYECLILLRNDQLDLYTEKINKIFLELKKYNNTLSNELKLIIIQNISTNYRNTQRLYEAIQLLIREGIPLAKKNNNEIILASYYQIIAVSFYQIQDYNKSKKYYLDAIDLYLKQNTKSEDLLVSCYIDFSECLIASKDFKLADEILQKANKFLIANENNNLNPKYYSSKGTLSLERNEIDKALYFFKEGLKFYEEDEKLKISDKLFFILKLGLAESKFHIGDYEDAITILSNMGYYDDDIEQYRIELLHKIMKKKGDYAKAYYYLDKYNSLKDSIEKASKELLFRRLESKYNASEKEKKILKLENEKAQKEVYIKNMSIRFVILFGILIIVLLITYFWYKNYKNVKRANQQQKIIHSQNLEFLNSLKEIEIMQAMMEGEESERKRIARDLHDGIGSRLSSLKMKLESLNSNSNKENDFDVLISNLSQTIKDLRQTALNLIPETLSKLGLDMAINDLCLNMSTNKINILYSSSEISSKIIHSHQIVIFRIVQELINNALKHSKSSEILVDCSQNGELFLITVEDNGIGFNIQEIDCFNGFGLKNIKNRVELLNGTLEIKSTSCSGTVFNIELKVKLNG